MLEKYIDQMPDRSGADSRNCGARRILSRFGLNTNKNNFPFHFIEITHKKNTYVNLNKAGCSLNICASCSVSKRKSFSVSCFL
jgi:hypothetical protein